MTTLFDNKHILVTIEDFTWSHGMGTWPSAVVRVKRGAYATQHLSIHQGTYPFALVTINGKEVIDAPAHIQRYLTIVAHAIESDADWQALSSIVNF